MAMKNISLENSEDEVYFSYIEARYISYEYIEIINDSRIKVQGDKDEVKQNNLKNNTLNEFWQVGFSN